jgi:hypothetical protein
MKVSVMLGLAAFSLCVGGSSLSAQECGEVLECQDMDEFAHSFAQGGDESSHTSPEGFHALCNVCEVWNGAEWVPVPAGACHATCPNLLREEEQEALENLLAAAAAGNVSQALEAGKKIRSRVSINADRRALQILGCDELAVATIPLGDLYDKATQDFGQVSAVERAERNAETGVPVAASILAIGLLAMAPGLRVRRPR